MKRTVPALEASALDHPLRQIVDSSSAVIYIKDLDGRYRLVNPAFERFFGLSSGQVLGRSDHELFPPAVADTLRANDVSVAARGHSVEFEEEVRLGDGAWVYLSSKFPLFDAERRVIAVCGISTDISERKRVEEALRHVALGVSAATGDAVFEAIVRYLARSLQADFAFVSRLSEVGSQRLSTLALYYAGELRENISYPLAGTPCAEVFGKRFHLVEGGLSGRYVADANLRQFNIDSYAGYPLFASDGRPLGLIAVGHHGPLPEHGRVEAILRIFSVRAAAELQRLEAEASYRAIFEASEDAIFVHDLRSGALVDVNPRACEAYGYRYEEMLRLTVDDFSAGYPPYTGAEAARWLTRAREEGPQRFEWHRRNRDGSLHWDEVFLKRAPIAGIERILAFTREITQRKEAERQREQLERQLRQAQRMEAIGHLTGGIAHDFNNLLTSMLGYTVMAAELAERQGDERQCRYLAQVQRSAEKARDLIQQMLTFSRGSRGQPQPVELGRLLDEFRPLLQSALPSSVEMTVELLDGLPPALVDPVQLEQVLMNLCINARDAMGGSGRLRIGLERRMRGEGVCASCLQAFAGDFLVLSVADSGPGIAEAVQAHMFEPFFTTKPPGQGSGMGLSMVHGIAHEYGGHLLLHSRPGEGACFEVLLPTLVQHAPPSRGAQSGAAPHQAQPLLRGRVAVVDDDPLVGEFMVECLSRWGLEVRWWADAEEAAGALASAPYAWDLVILDQCMPQLSGLQLARRLLAVRADLPIVLYTGFSDPLGEAEVQAQGIRALWHKPLDPARLHGWLHALLPAETG